MSSRGDVPLPGGHSDGCGDLSVSRQARREFADKLLAHILNLKENGINIGLALFYQLNQDYPGEFDDHIQQVLSKQSAMMFGTDNPKVQITYIKGDKHEYQAGSTQVVSYSKDTDPKDAVNDWVKKEQEKALT